MTRDELAARLFVALIQNSDVKGRELCDSGIPLEEDDARRMADEAFGAADAFEAIRVLRLKEPTP